jgi:Sad1 / UNC-like C-terminal
MTSIVIRSVTLAWAVWTLLVTSTYSNEVVRDDTDTDTVTITATATDDLIHSSSGGSSSNANQLERIIEGVLQTSGHTIQNYQQSTSIQTEEVISSSSNETQFIDYLQSLRDHIHLLEERLVQWMKHLNLKKSQEIQRYLEFWWETNFHTTTNTDIVTIEELERLISKVALLNESESILSDWMIRYIDHEISTHVNQTMRLYNRTHRMNPVHRRNQNAPHRTNPTDNCISVETAALKVYHALLQYTQDRIGKRDYTKSVVHQFTSPTYVVPLEDNTSKATTKSAATQETIGMVWWNRFIPQDWERFLPMGWQSWKIAGVIPDHFYHSMGGGTSRTTTTQIITTTQITAPPDAIVQTTTLPGYCWPVPMQRRQQQQKHSGVVTIRLQEPIIVTAITIDHVSKHVLVLQSTQLKSAPKRMKVYGYAPCQSNHCNGLGFDVTSKSVLTEITYSIHEENSVQTFPVPRSRTRNESLTSVDPNSEDTGSCSAVTESCGSTEPLLTAAVTVEVLDNWGNEYYTCLYRFRVHGDPQH